MKNNSTIAAYNAIAPYYEEYSSGRQCYLDSVDKLVIERIKPGSRLLDVGSGDGRRLKKITDSIPIQDAIAIEPSPNMAAICAERSGFPVHNVFSEDINPLNLGQFDAITALWNVFGHISSENRLRSLNNLKSCLKPDGIVILDVNNRHNAIAYGAVTVIKRIIVDFFDFMESRGDSHYEWKIGDKSYPSFGHLFTPFEIEGLFKKAGLKIKDRYSVNYTEGSVSRSPYHGQLFYCLSHS